MFETETLKMTINFEVEKKVNRISYRISFYVLTLRLRYFLSIKRLSITEVT